MNRKVPLILLVLLFGMTVSEAQKIRQYYDSIDRPVSPERSYYYVVRSTSLPAQGDTIRAFYSGSERPREVYYLDGQGGRQGVHFQYHPDGSIAAKTSYKEDHPLGVSMEWYPGGRPRLSRLAVIRNGVFEGQALVNYWDSTGNQLIRDGSGYCQCYLKSNDGRLLQEVGKLVQTRRDSIWIFFYQGKVIERLEYEMGKIVAGPETEEIFTVVEVSAEPVDGYAAFYAWIGRELKYPLQARRMGVEGKVIVEFTVQKDGSITDAKVKSGIGAGCDEEALRIIRAALKWEPGLQQGKPVRQVMVMPIPFKLGSVN